MKRSLGDESEFLTIDPRCCIGDKIRDAREDEVTLERMADMLDGDAEAANAHGLVGVHRALAAIMHAEIGRRRATLVMREIADRKGLHQMQDEWDSDLPKPWKAWKLKD